MNTLLINFLETIYAEQKETSLQGKWITFNDIKTLFSKYESKFVISQIGTSEENRPIMQLKIGKGSKKYYYGLKCTATKVQEQGPCLIYLIVF